jgi:hypothetical protein
LPLTQCSSVIVSSPTGPNTLTSSNHLWGRNLAIPAYPLADLLFILQNTITTSVLLLPVYLQSTSEPKHFPLVSSSTDSIHFFHFSTCNMKSSTRSFHSISVYQHRPTDRSLHSVYDLSKFTNIRTQSQFPSAVRYSANFPNCVHFRKSLPSFHQLMRIEFTPPLPSLPDLLLHPPPARSGRS